MACTNGTACPEHGPAQRECCFLLCRCWIDLEEAGFPFPTLSGAARLVILAPVAAGILLSLYNIFQHTMAYRNFQGGQPLSEKLTKVNEGNALHPCEERAVAARALYLRMRVAFIVVLATAPLLGAVAWSQLYFGGFHATADAIVMLVEAVSINSYLQMVLAFVGGRDAVATILEQRGMRTLWMIPINQLDESSSPRAKKCISCCMKINCKLFTFKSSKGLLDFWVWSVIQMLPVKGVLAVLVVLTNHLMTDGGESMRYPINVVNIVSMIMAVRGNVALYFELRTGHLDGLRPILKYVSCRAVLSAAVSQRFLFDVTVLDPELRFDMLNLVLCAEMTGLAVIWFFVFSYKDRVFQHIVDAAISPPATAETAALDTGETAIVPVQQQELIIQV
eukprot:COSAG05_NODE_3236_length_2216_cov_259.874350_2_plen_392_part_00